MKDNESNCKQKKYTKIYFYSHINEGQNEGQFSHVTLYRHINQKMALRVNDKKSKSRKFPIFGPSEKRASQRTTRINTLSQQRFVGVGVMSV